MPVVAFEFMTQSACERRTVTLCDLVIAGWTGRDPHKVQEHIDELASIGIAPPATTPCFYRAGIEMVTTSPEIDCLGSDSSGEAEYFILVDEAGEWWIGGGSDHTDRKVEAYSIPVSKQMCPKPVAPTLWRFAELADHWDALELTSWVEEDDVPVAYQAGSIAAMRDPRDTVARYEAVGHALRPGTVMFGGTLPVLGGIRPRRSFALELRDPVLGRSIAHRYTARWLAA